MWLAGSLVTLWQLELLPDSALGAGFEPMAVARSLAAGQGFANPYEPLATGPTAHCGPVYPWLLAQVLRLYGGVQPATTPLILVHAVLHGLQFALLPLLSFRLLGRRTPGLIGACLLALPILPVLVQFETIVLTLCLLLCLMVEVLPWTAAPAALLGALALHVNPSGLFLLAGWLWWKKPGRRWLVVYVLTIVAACIPWMIRNYRTIGAVGFVRDNLPLELYVSNNDISGPSMMENPGLVRLHPNTSLAEAQDLKAMGEAAYMRDRGRRALEWIQSHPGRFFRLTAIRAWQYWLPRIDNHPWQAAFIRLITLLALPGMWRLRRHPVFVAAFVFSPLLYFVIQSEPHYRYPFLWATLLAAGVTLSGLYAGLQVRPDQQHGLKAAV